MAELLTTRQIARLISGEPAFGGDLKEWRVRRLFEDGTLPEPQRVAGKRVLTREDIPAIVAAARAKGWLPQSELEAVAS